MTKTRLIIVALFWAAQSLWTGYVLPNTTVAPKGLTVVKYDLEGKILEIEISGSTTHLTRSVPLDYGSVNRELATLRALLNKSSPSEVDGHRLRTSLEKMYAVFIAPVEDLIPKNGLLCFIPGKSFGAYPFHLFMKDGVHLIENYFSFYAIDRRQISDAANEPVLRYPDAVADDPARYSDRLGSAIMESLGIPGIPALSEQAPIDQLKYVFQYSKVLYLTSHGNFDAKNMRYWLEMKPHPIAANALDLKDGKMKFVFANACESALLFVFPHKCFDLKVTTFIGSMWDHPSTDRATANVVKRFFGNWKSGMSKVESLVIAQRETLRKEREANGDARDTYRKNGDNPHFWGQFVLVGDWR
jgi:hypothetical protein